MALPPTFSARVRTSTVPRQQRNTANNPGAAVAEGLTMLGRTGSAAQGRREASDDRIAASEQRVEELEIAREREAARLAHARALSEQQVALSEAIGALEAEPAAGAEGHREAVQEQLNTAWGKLSEQLPDDAELFDQARTEFARFADRQLARADTFERRERALQQGDDYEAFASGQAMVAYNEGSAEAIGDALAAGADYIGSMDLGEREQAELMRLYREQVIASGLSGLADGGHFEALNALLESGAYDEVLGVEGKSNWVRQVATGRDAASRAADLAQGEAQGAALEQLRSIEVILDNGGEVSPSEVNAAMATARDVGVDGSDILEFAYMHDSAIRVQTARGLENGTLQAQNAAIAARMARGEASREDRAQFEANNAVLGFRDAETGAGIRDLAGSGAQGRGQAVEQLAGMPWPRRNAAAREADMPILGVYAGLEPVARAAALVGEAARSERPEMFLPPAVTGATSDSARRDIAQGMFASTVGEDIAFDLAANEDFQLYLDAALDLMAGRAQGWDQAAFAQSIQQVFGATQRSDGTWQGGIERLRDGGPQVELPRRWSAAEFREAWNSADFAATGAEYLGGGAASNADVRRHFRPVPMPPLPNSQAMRYMLVGSGNAYLTNSEGQMVTITYGPSTRYGWEVGVADGE